MVYLAIGAVAAAVALGIAERPGNARRVMLLIEHLPMGSLLLVALSLGLLGYAALNLVGAARDHEQRGRSFSGVMMRGADVLTGALYVALAVAGVRIAAARGLEGGTLIEAWAAAILLIPGGQLLLGALGLALIGAGGFLLHRARVKPFETVLDRRALSPRARRLLARSARFGTVTRGVIFAICGLLAIEAAARRAADRVGDVGDALSAIETTPAGRGALGVVSLGFMAYGVYQLAKARYRRVPIG